MIVLRRVLRNAIAGIVVIAGVGSLFAVGIMYGVKIAYADTQNHTGFENLQQRIECVDQTRALESIGAPKG